MSIACSTIRRRVRDSVEWCGVASVTSRSRKARRLSETSCARRKVRCSHPHRRPGARRRSPCPSPCRQVYIGRPTPPVCRRRGPAPWTRDRETDSLLAATRVRRYVCDAAGSRYLPNGGDRIRSLVAAPDHEAAVLQGRRWPSFARIIPDPMADPHPPGRTRPAVG